VDELHRTDLSALGYEDVDLRTRPVQFVSADRTATQAVPPAGLDTRHHRVGTAKDECGMHQLVRRRMSGEQQNDAGQDAPPRTAVETSSIHGPLRDTQNRCHGADASDSDRTTVENCLLRGDSKAGRPRELRRLYTIRATIFMPGSCRPYRLRSMNLPSGRLFRDLRLTPAPKAHDAPVLTGGHPVRTLAPNRRPPPEWDDSLMSSLRSWKPTWRAGVAVVLAAGIASTEGCSPPAQGTVKLKGDRTSQSENLVNPLGKAKTKEIKLPGGAVGKDIKRRGM